MAWPHNGVGVRVLATLDDLLTTTAMMQVSSRQADQAGLRQAVLDALEDFWWPLAPATELGPYLEAVHRRPVTADAWDELLNDERRAFLRGEQRDPWLCLGIRPDLTGDPERWARSDWPLWVRVVGPDDARIRPYWLLRQLDRAPVMPGEPGTQSLTALWTRLAAQLPTHEVALLRSEVERDPRPGYDWQQDRFSIWAEVADELFGRLAEDDRREREAVARRLGRLDVADQLFGIEGP